MPRAPEKANSSQLTAHSSCKLLAVGCQLNKKEKTHAWNSRTDGRQVRHEHPRAARHRDGLAGHESLDGIRFLYGTAYRRERAARGRPGSGRGGAWLPDDGGTVARPQHRKSHQRDNSALAFYFPGPRLGIDYHG